MQERNATSSVISGQAWVLLLALSILWGGSFLFIGIAVRELSPLLLVFARVGIAALILVPLHLVLQGPLPRKPSDWVAAAGMSVLNNVVPFSLIVYGQQFISAGLASVINATTPLFGALFMAAAGLEALTSRKIGGLLLGLLGVAVLRGVHFADLNQEALAIACVIAASASYGASSLWARKRLAGQPPLTTATCQLLVSSVVMGVLAAVFAEPGDFLDLSPTAAMAILALAVLSTALAYLLFFRIIAIAGSSVVLLVTMLIPVSAIAMGALFLGEQMTVQEITGALLIGAGLLVIDGRVMKKLGWQ